MTDTLSREGIGRFFLGRSRASTRSASARSRRARIVCIASGKGGVGKSVIASNLAVVRAARGERVLLVDFDAGLANDHLLLGLAPVHDLASVLDGKVSAEAAMVEGPAGVHLVSGGVGRMELVQPSRRELERVFRALRPLEERFDLIVVDHGAGLSYSTLAHLAVAPTLLLVASHEVTALSDAYAMFKRALLVNRSIRAGLVINRAPTQEHVDSAWQRFAGACRKFLGSVPELVGWVPADDAIPESVDERRPVVLANAASPAARSIERLAAWQALDLPPAKEAFYDLACAALR
jgi:flagellar biosynthesis protein FlhG